MIARHEITLDQNDLLDLRAGVQVEKLTNKQMQVTLSTSPVQPENNSVNVVVNDFALGELDSKGHTGLVPKNSPYVFGLYA